MIKGNITKKYSVYSPTGDVLLQEALQSFQSYNMYFTQFHNFFLYNNDNTLVTLNTSPNINYRSNLKNMAIHKEKLIAR